MAISLSRFQNSLPALSVAAVLAFASSTTLAAPATFVTALPVAENQALVRFNVQPAFGPDDYSNVQFPVNIGYGLTPSWALFVNFNQGFATLSGNPTFGGTGDLLVFARYTLYKLDKLRSTFRIAPLGGLSLPIGSNHNSSNSALAPGALQPGSGTVDPYVGITSAYNTPRYGAALDATWRHNPVTGSGYSPGSQFHSDGQVEFTLLPLHLPEEGLPKLLVLSLEANYAQQTDSHLNGIHSASANKTFSQDAVFELASLHWEAGLGAQFPVMQHFALPSPAKEHIGFYAFFEYYLSTPNWHHRKKQ